MSDPVHRPAHYVGDIECIDAVAGMAYYKCNKSMVVTNSQFTKSAQQFAKTTSCILIGRKELIVWITAYRQSAANRQPESTPPQKTPPRQAAPELKGT